MAEISASEPFQGGDYGPVLLRDRKPATAAPASPASTTICRAEVAETWGPHSEALEVAIRARSLPSRWKLRIMPDIADRWWRIRIRKPNEYGRFSRVVADIFYPGFIEPALRFRPAASRHKQPLAGFEFRLPLCPQKQTRSQNRGSAKAVLTAPKRYFWIALRDVLGENAGNKIPVSRANVPSSLTPIRQLYHTRRHLPPARPRAAVPPVLQSQKPLNRKTSPATWKHGRAAIGI